MKNGPSAFTTKWHLRRDRENNGDAYRKTESKLQLLELTQEKTEGIISTGITEKIRRHKEALQGIVIGAEEIKREVEQAKLEGGETLEEVKEWGKEFELKIDAADTVLRG